MEQIYDIIAVVVSLIVGFAVGRGVKVYSVMKFKLKQLEQITIAISNVLSTINKAIEDDKVTKEEISEIVSSINRLLHELRRLI